jgi:hypothetical protein
MTTRELFEFVTDPTINQSNMDSYLEKVPFTYKSQIYLFIYFKQK